MSGKTRCFDAAGVDREQQLRQLSEKRAQVISSMSSVLLRAVIDSMRQKRDDAVELLCSGTGE